ncbi:septum site-determining protein Ssd [Jiangella sp. DSM 45060]|uniref:septum site-determining protein Ssd n=1 Tax=Jiangella sp. DSM 45060 TaxID=1798224 RepID=UPI00087D6FA3|nr:septum site-determining protein Ssd [Jiangella sp. DSM 45060]SDT71338.1 helicase/secretion neighborhood CpaE-like protein [Jiangella sp. DSM 45060]
MSRTATRPNRRPAGPIDVPPPPRPLVITHNDAVLDDLLRIAAAASVELEVVDRLESARSRWSHVPLVVVGDDEAEAVTAMSLPRRPGVILVGDHDDDAGIWRRGVAIGAEQVLFFPEGEPWLAGRFADAAEGGGGDALVVGVMGGRGGAGASVLATGLAATASRQGMAVILADLDPLGGGLDLVLGAEDVTGLRWPDLADSKGRLGARALRSELPGRHGLAVLSWDRGDLLTLAPDAADVVLAAARRAVDLVVLDLPRWPDPAAEYAIGLCASVLLVVPAEVRAVASATRVAASLTTLAADVRVVTRGPSSSGLRGPDVAMALGLPFALHLPAEPRLGTQLDRGESPGLDNKGPLVQGCGRLLESLLRDHRLVGT